jgi:SSS family solute:Na+ symporter
MGGAITHMIAVLMSGLCVCGLLGRLWPAYNWQGAMASLLTGMLTALMVSAYPPWIGFLGNSILPAVFNAAVAGIMVTLATRKPPSLGPTLHNTYSDEK